MKKLTLVTWLLAVCLAGVVASGQQTRPPTQDNGRPAKESDDPRARAEWFRRGRTLPDGSAAGKLEQAWRQKMQMRARQAASSSRTSSSSSSTNNASVPGGPSASIITNVIQWGQ